jgi:CxxC-x17-CxxC domain-containing protein
MSFHDKLLQCSDCGITFMHSAEDQEFYQCKGYANEPKRCLECRQARKAERYGNSNDSYDYKAKRKMFSAVCADCGKETEVPFEPCEGKPVYCGNCLRKVRSNR